MSDGYNFGFDSVVFPAVPGETLSSLDPVTNTILRYFTNVIKINLGAAFAADAALCGFTNAKGMNFLIDGYMVAQSVSFPVSSSLSVADYKFPLLSVYRTKRKFTQNSSMKVIIESEYDVNYILPPLSIIQFNKLYKYLSAVSDVLVDRTWRGLDINYNHGEQVWKTAKVAYALMHGDEYGSFLGQDGKTEFPSIKLSLTMMEESQFVPSNYNELDNVFFEVDLHDGYNLALPINNFVDGYANPNLSITSLNINSGSILGGTAVLITGSGFENVISSIIPTYAVTLNGAPVSRLIVRSNTILLISSGPGVVDGIGDVVVTDKLGNTITLTNGWQYNG